MGAILLIVLIGVYNRLVRERQEVYSAWHTVEAELARRSQLVPQLVTAVRLIAAHEQQLLVSLEQRNRQAIELGFDPPAASQWDAPLATAIRQVVALRERYPALNSQQNYLRLQFELSMTEDRIAAARRYYNLQVRQLNDLTGVFPRNIVAKMTRIRPAPFFGDGSAPPSPPRIDQRW